MPKEQLARSARDVPWMSVDDAATVIGVPVLTLRRAIERNARRGTDGTIVASVDGVRARKFQRRWRVTLDNAWLAPGAGDPDGKATLRR